MKLVLLSLLLCGVSQAALVCSAKHAIDGIKKVSVIDSSNEVKASLNGGSYSTVKSDENGILLSKKGLIAVYLTDEGNAHYLRVLEFCSTVDFPCSGCQDGTEFAIIGTEKLKCKFK